MWEVDYTEEFEEWWNTLKIDVKKHVDAALDLLEEHGPNLKFPKCSGVEGSKYSHMRELRIQHKGEPYWILYAFDPRRCAILLIGGNKIGNEHWYKKFIPIADKLYKDHLEILRREGY